MRRFSAHGKLLALMSALLVLPAAAAALTGCGLLAGPAADRIADAYDRIVPGMTRANDLAGLGFDTHDATVADNALLDHIKDRAADACIAADRYCTGYVFASHAGEVVLLVMDGRVTDKAILHA
jgi:hypothetical protein